MEIDNDVKAIREFRKSPILFIKVMWGLVPQPLKPEYEDIAKSTPLQEFKPKWFERFVRGRHLTWQQWIILLAVEKALRGEESPRISVRSGHGIGKDATLSWLILWYLFCFKDSQVPATAPTSEQIHDILWKEVSVWLKRMPEDIQALYEWQSGHVRMVESPETWFARARTARKENPEALAGIHAKNVFYAIDEASGIADEIFKPAEGALTSSDILMVLLSNPTRLVGYFYDSHHKDSANWQCLHFNSEDSPIVDWKYVDRIETKYGKDSDEYKVRVAGDFPGEDAVDAQGYVPLLRKQDIHLTKNSKFVGEIRLGLDVAGSGRNKTEWMARDRFKAKCLLTETISTPKSVSQKTLTLMTHYEIDPEKIWEDNFGEGANVPQEIALAKKDCRINGVSFGDEPDDKERFLNKRAEMYVRMKDWFRGGGEIVNDQELIEQLLSIRYREELSGRLKLMSKKEMLKEAIPSPDKADALALTFYEEETENKKEEDTEPPYQPQSELEGGEEPEEWPKSRPVSKEELGKM